MQFTVSQPISIKYILILLFHVFVGLPSSSEMCHPCCVFKLYGEVNSVKNTTINIWLNDGVY